MKGIHEEMRYKFALNTFVLLCLLSSCRGRKDDAPAFLGLEYQPIEIGHSVCYEVDQIKYIFGEGPDTSHFYVKEEVVEELSAVNGDTYYRLDRFYKPHLDSLWTIDSVWSFRRTPYQYSKTIDNKPFVKLSFPLEENKSWDGNALNTTAEERYTMELINRPYTVNGYGFDSTVTVVQISDSSKIHKELRKEIFAHRVGMVQKQTEVYEYCQEESCFGKNEIETGLYQLMRYYKE